MNYKTFLEKKSIIDQKSGFKVPLDKLNSMLFDWQKVLVQWALARGRAALFEDCGLGKTIQLLDWSYQIFKKEKEPILILAPLAISEQTKREGNKFDIKVNICKSQKDVINGINITNYEKLHKFNPDKFIGIVADECFAPDTPIEVFSIDNSLTMKYIKDIVIGDKIHNVKGIDYVHNICKRPINRAIQVCIEGRRFTCSENHPWFTMHGWKFAKDLQTSDYLMATKEAVCLVRNNFQTKIFSKQNGQVLRKILLSEMENEYTRIQGKSTYSGNCCQEGQEKIAMASKRKSKSIERTGKNSQFESNVESRNGKKDDCYQNSKRNFQAMERGKRRQWKANSYTATNNDRNIGKRLDLRISNKDKRKGWEWLSLLLQGGFSKSKIENNNRNRWLFSWIKKRIGLQKRSETCFFRVENIKILEQGHPELEKYRDKTGIVHFYDIETKWHPSFSVNGILVHNSSILKNFAGKIRNEIIDMFGKTKYRLACTATPSPNDYTELGNHAEFLGIMSRSEMLATFFINDTGNTGTWRIKGHVRDNIFWKWLASWAVMITKPSDIGFEDKDFILPEIKYHQHIIQTNEKPKFGFFPEIAQTMDERRKVRRDTVQIRCKEAFNIIRRLDN